MIKSPSIYIEGWDNVNTMTVKNKCGKEDGGNKKITTVLHHNSIGSVYTHPNGLKKFPTTSHKTFDLY